VTVVARQFGRPHGLFGMILGRRMVHSNGALSRWVVEQSKSSHIGAAVRIAELGPGPGIGLAALLMQFRDAHVWGIDVSPVMLAQARKRNAPQIRAGRLTLITGSAAALAEAAPADIVMANHVLYFWHDPHAELELIRRFLRPGGLLAVGYQLRHELPAMAQKRFPQVGHLLYDSDDDVARLARASGFSSVINRALGPADGRVMLALN
jgi:SAM-dependent methyltransferase